MAALAPKTRFRFWLWLIALIGVIVPRRLRADWRQEWEAELRNREAMLEDWDRLNWQSKLELIRRSASAFWDALWLLPKRWEDEMIQDLRYGARMLLRRPGFTAVAVITLALGIGAVTTIFSVAYAVWLRPLPYPESERLALVWTRRTNQTPGTAGNFELTPANYLDLLRENKSFERMAAIASNDFNLTGDGEPERLKGQVVSAAFFPLLRAAPIAGRAFTDADDREGAARVVILSHGLWERRFGARADVIGRTLTLNDLPYTVVGVMPPGFVSPDRNAEIWTPISFPASAAEDRGSYYLSAIARLKPGVTFTSAQSEADVIAGNLAQAYPRSNTNIGFSVVAPREYMVRDFKQSLFVLMGAVAFLLLIACVNVANLLLARAASREKELALRAALGAGRRRLIRQLLTESALLALCGSALGLLLAIWGIQALKLISPTGPGAVAGLDEAYLDWRALVFTLGVACLTSVLFGLAPALHISKPDLQSALKDGGRGSSSPAGRLRGALVVAEVALSLALLVGAGLLIRSFIRLQSVDPGFDTERLLTMGVVMSQEKARDLANISNFYQQVIERAESMPGVKAAGVATAAPIAMPGMRSAVAIEDKPAPPPGTQKTVNNRVVSPGYFRTLAVPLLKGRLLSEQDTSQTPAVVVINQAMARRYWGDEDPIGKRFKIGARSSNVPWLTVVGLVGDVRQAGLNSDPLPEMYTPFTQEHPRWVRPRVLFIRATGDPLSLIAAVKNQIWAVDKDQTINDIRTMEEIVGRSLAPRRFNLLLLGIFAALALALASVGIYGVMSFAVSQRAREIGVRMALGASRRDIFKLIVGKGLALTLAGVAVGLVSAFALTRWLESLLFGVAPNDPLTFAGVALLLTLVALLACYLPARRATKLNPMIALRNE